jgi:CO/xanthine dehydrogenase FAD-binding subunit
MAFALIAPRTVAEAVKLSGRHAPGELAVLAGGTDLLLDLDDARIAPKVVLSLRKLPWSTLRWQGRRLTIGSTLPFRALETNPRVRKNAPGLYEAVRAVGSVALRNRATLGGNLGRASPASDLIPILLALDARASLIGPEGPRESSVADLIQGPRQNTLLRGELIRSITIPSVGPSTFVWQRVRAVNDISQVGVAVAHVGSPATWRVAVGGVWPCPKRIPDAERLLTSHPPTHVEVEFAAQEAARVAPFVTDKRATEAYRRRLVMTLTRLALRRTIDQLPAKKKRSRRAA